MYKSFFLVFFVVLSAIASASSCPAGCTCTKYTLNCRNANLYYLPENISSLIAYIDLTNNPNLHLLPNYFERFKQLVTLRLKNCSIYQPMNLPESIRAIDLSHNLLTMDSVTKMFSAGKYSHLKDLSLGSNKIQINGTGLSAFPKNITKLILTGNRIVNIRKEDLTKYINLKRFEIRDCRITEIEAGAFDSLKKLTILKMSGNKLTKLPSKLFQFTTQLNILEMSKNNLSKLPSKLFQFTAHLNKLYISRNNLTAVPNLSGIKYLLELKLERNKLTSVTSKDLGVKGIRKIDLSRNKIEHFNLNATDYIHLDLSRNHIKTIDDYAFANRSGSQKDVGYLLLQDNGIKHISPEAFRGIRLIHELFLQRCNITFLPKGLFKGMQIRRLYLFGNNLNHTKGLLHGMRQTPDMVLLFGNPNISSFEASDFENMGSNSVIFTGCTNLKTIESGHNLRANVICSPSSDLVVSTNIPALQGDGFHCKKKKGKAKHLYSCTPCPVGTWEECKTDDCNGICNNCPAGSFYQDEMASVYCKWCPPGQFVPPHSVPGKKAIDCLTCPKNTNTNGTAGYRACPCLSEYARTERFGPCEKCTQEGIKCENDYRELKKDYWMTWDSIVDASNVSCKDLYKKFMENLKIKSDKYDPSTVNFTGCRMPLPQKCPIIGSCTGGVDAVCKRGYTGPLCAVCSDKYMKQFARCRKCPQKGVAIAQSIAYFLSFFFICFLISATDKIELAENDQQGGDNDQEGDDSDQQGDQDSQRGDDNTRPGSKRTFADIILSSLKILMGFYQVVSGLIHALSYINWPHSLKSVMSSFQFIQFEILRIPSLHCINPEWRLNAVKEFWVALIATFAVPLLIFVYFAIRSLYFFCCSVDSAVLKENIRDCARHSLRAAILFLFATYPLTCTRIVQILPFSCHTFCTVMGEQGCLRNVRYLRSDYSVDCAHDLSRSLQKTAYAALAIPLGFPIALLLLLYHYSPRPVHGSRSRNAPDHSEYVRFDSFNNESANKDEDVIQFAMRFAYENYNRKCWYWEVVEMIRKLLLTVGIVFFLNHTKIGLAGIITIATIFTMAQAAMNPIRDKFENFLQLLSLTIVPINLSIGAIIHSKGIQDADIIDEKQDSIGMGVILIFLNSLLIALVSFRFIRSITMKIISIRKKKNKVV